jgi:hypothetical protein
VAGQRNAFANWARQVGQWSSTVRGAEQLAHLEDIAPLQASKKLRSIPQGRDEALLEVVLHSSGDPKIIKAFEAYALRHGARPLMARQRSIGGLTFIPVGIAPERAEELARFAFVRVARGMPSLRPFDPGVLRAALGAVVRLPSGGPVDQSLRAVVFDGGLPPDAVAALAPWVRLIEPTGIGAPIPEYQAHGLGVTSALLFGPLDPRIPPPRPLCHVDHVRVLDGVVGDAAVLQYIDVLDRILAVLDSNEGKYQFVNISLGPNLAVEDVEDDEVTVWTASLDERFANGNVVATVAVGNDGHLNAEIGLNRVQPPADGVNLLAVGATDRRGQDWQRATYSCVGPGRSPGLVKPDGVIFGGSVAEPFVVLGTGLTEYGVTGTSFAAPHTLRSGVAVRTQLGDALRPLAIRALLIHRAKPDEHEQTEVG